MRLSIVVPSYEMNGHGTEFLSHLLSSVAAQTYKDVEVIVSDDSTGDDIERLCKNASSRLDVKYFRHDGPKRSSANVNNAIKNASSEIVKVIFQDDFLFDTRSLEWIVSSHKSGSKWTLSSCVHTHDGMRFFRHHVPSFHAGGYLGENLAGSPSGLSFLKSDKTFFDEKLVWLMDCEFYHRLSMMYGKPAIIPDPSIANRLWNGQVTNAVDEAVKVSELSYVWSKFND